MGQTVYVDLFFLINFSMDFLCFFLTAKILGRRMSLWRGILGAVIGGLYADAALFFSLGRLASFALEIGVCAIMCAAVYGEKRRWRSLPLYILVYVAISMALGGFMTALFNLLNRSALFDGIEQSEGDGISVWVFALLALVSGAITLLGGRFFAGKTAQKHAEIEVRYGGRSACLQAMTDSGNLLCEPISGRPCIVADLAAMEQVLPQEILRAARTEPAVEITRISREHARNLRLIPTKTASGEGMLIGVRMERIAIRTEKEEKEVDAMVALADLGSTAGGKDALLPARLLL